MSNCASFLRPLKQLVSNWLKDGVRQAKCTGDSWFWLCAFVLALFSCLVPLWTINPELDGLSPTCQDALVNATGYDVQVVAMAVENCYAQGWNQSIETFVCQSSESLRLWCQYNYNLNGTLTPYNYLISRTSGNPSTWNVTLPICIPGACLGQTSNDSETFLTNIYPYVFHNLEYGHPRGRYWVCNYLAPIGDRVILILLVTLSFSCILRKLRHTEADSTLLLLLGVNCILTLVAVIVRIADLILTTADHKAWLIILQVVQLLCFVSQEIAACYLYRRHKFGGLRLVDAWVVIFWFITLAITVVDFKFSSYLFTPFFTAEDLDDRFSLVYCCFLFASWWTQLAFMVVFFKIRAKEKKEQARILEDDQEGYQSFS